ncbi:MAG: hypothetical protein ACKVW3_09895 [Phycisphaerales bacterium]
MADRTKAIKLAVAGTIFIVAVAVAYVRLSGSEPKADDLVDRKAQEIQAAIQQSSTQPPPPDRAPANTPRAKSGDRGAKSPDGN